MSIDFFQVVANKKPNLLVGSLICGAVPIRDPHNKWYCPDYMFSRKVYPNYLSGTAYLMSRSTALSLFEAASKVAIFHLEDIYVTGILAEQVIFWLILAWPFHKTWFSPKAIISLHLGRYENVEWCLEKDHLGWHELVHLSWQRRSRKP